MRVIALYIAVGICTTIIDFGLLRLGIACGLVQPLAVSVAIVTAGVFQFSMYRFVVFRARERPVGLQAGGYFATLAVAWWSTVLLVEGFTHWLLVGTLVAKMMTIPIVLPVGFLVNRYIVFHR